jgi:hypothetical protein
MKEEYNKELKTHFTTKMGHVLIPILPQLPDIFYGRVMARNMRGRQSVEQRHLGNPQASRIPEGVRKHVGGRIP